MKDSQQFVFQVPEVALPLVAIAYLCLGEAWVQSRQQATHKPVGWWRHALMVTGYPLAYMWWAARWWVRVPVRTAWKAVHGRLRP